MTPTGQEAGDTSAVGTGAFDPERANLSQAPGPPFELPIPERGCRRLMLAKADTLPVNGHRHMLIPVGAGSDDNLNSMTTFTTHNSYHSYLPEDGAPAR